MYKQVMIENTNAQDFSPIFSGHEICKKNHRFGPYTRNYYIIHFCLNGKGELFDKYGRHTISAGELFIIRPEEITTYVADAQNPWEYAWIAFDGNMADVFQTNQSVYSVPMDIGASIRDYVQQNITAPSAYIALLFRLLYCLFSESKEPQNVVEKIKQYVRFHYMNDLTVRGLSLYFGFERSYLYRLFQRNCGIGIKDFITQTRMEQARILLKKGYGVGETATAVGYKDPFNFSKAYKGYFGTAPKQEKSG